MRSRRILGVFLLTMLIGQPVFAVGADCFCLTDDDDAVWFDCVTQIRHSSPNPLFFCMSPETQARERIPGGHQKTKLADGEGACKPCRGQDVTGSDAIRGDKENQAPAGTNSGKAQ